MNSSNYSLSNNDQWIATDGNRLLTLAAASSKPFFVAVGLHKPHTPYVYPRNIDSMYPPVDKMDVATGVSVN